MKATVNRLFSGYAALIAAALLIACGSYEGPTSPAGGASPPTITLTAGGASPSVTRISAGQQVRFINNDTQNHQMNSDPFPGHQDCPQINDIGTLTPGQSKLTSMFPATKSCGFHDHLNHDAKSFQGQILVDTSQPAPGYITTGGHH
jgi:plastocyanin